MCFYHILSYHVLPYPVASFTVVTVVTVVTVIPLNCYPELTCVVTVVGFYTKSIIQIDGIPIHV